MALAYVPPGVQVEEVFSPSVSPLLSVSASICLVGAARGYETGVAQVTFGTDGAAQTLNAPAGTVFQRVDTNNMFESAINLLDPTAGSGANQSGYVQGTDFQVTLPTDAKTVTVTPVADTTLATEGGILLFTYRYVPDGYYDPIRLDTQAAVEARFGPGFDANGIVTPLSAAASVAFENGAATVVIQPVFKDVGGLPAQPATPTEAASDVNWQTTLLRLRDIEDINIIVPVIGQSDANVDDAALFNVLQKVQDHVNYMQTQGQYLIGIFGEDSSTDISKATLATLRGHASVLGTRYGGNMAEQTVLVSPSRFSRSLPSTNRTILVGGQYVAAAVAGMVAARPVSTPLTRKQLSGFTSVAQPGYDKAQKDQDAQSGLMVVEQRGGVVQVRHAITLNNTDNARRELSVVRAKHRMMESIRLTLDTQIIGEVPADGNAALVVKNAVIGVLETLRAGHDLVDYTGVEARTISNDPTTVECRFSYRPAFPLNYVNVAFSLDLTAGQVDTTFTTTTV
jgi:hypothetical protein